MPLIWSDTYSVGLEEIDAQHRQLISIINLLEAAVVEINGAQGTADFASKITEVFARLVNYTALHFATEEVLMRMFEYGDYKQHKRSHDAFVEVVIAKHSLIETLLRTDNTQATKAELTNVHGFLQKWLVEHIMRSDTEYTHFFLAIQKKAKKSGGWLSFLGA